MKGVDGHTVAGTSAMLVVGDRNAQAEGWLDARVDEARTATIEYARARATEHFTTPDTAVLGRVLTDFVSRGKAVRSTFGYLGWLCGRPEMPGALQAAACLDLLHAFALIQDDVMDQSATRRGRPTVHVQLAEWAGTQATVTDAERTGRSAAVLLADLCLIWSERMLREADLPDAAVTRAWPVFDLLRAELAVGQYRDLLNEDLRGVSQETVMAIARSKSGNYTVLRPLEFGAALAGCSPEIVGALRGYGEAIGEAFQLRDDLLGVFGDPRVTGKPVGDDLRQRKATTVVVAARDLADGNQYRRLRQLMDQHPDLDDQDAWVADWQTMIRETGAEDWAERAIAARMRTATRALDSVPLIPDLTRRALVVLAERCAVRQH